MSRSRSGRTGETAARRSDDRRRSEAGDTLVEILISITVLGIAAVAILLAFATSISGSSAHRNAANMDVMLRTAAAEVTAAIQQQPSADFANCSGAYTLNNPSGQIPLPVTGYTATIQYAQYWTGTAFTPTAPPTNTGCPAGVQLVGTAPNVYLLGPQQLTVQVTFQGTNQPPTSQSITTVVQDPNAPASGTNCGDKATQLVWVGQPANGLAGSALSPPPTVVLEDASGCVEQQDASTVQLSIASGPTGATLNNCSAFPGNGETTFENCSLNLIGTYTLQASDPTDGIAPVQGNPFAITAGSPARLVFHQEPVNGTGGTPFATNAQPIVVWIEDSSGNVLTGDNSTVSLAIGTNPSGGTLSGCGSTAAVNGVATFTGCKIDKAGNGYTLNATDSADGLTNPTASTAFNIAVGPAAQLAFTRSPGNAIAGDKFGTQPMVTIQDLGGNTVTTNTSAVALAIGTNPAGGTLSGCAETTTGGVATFTGCSINNLGNGYTLVATDGALSPATSNPFNVATPVLTSFSVVPATITPTAGTAFNVTITGLDQAGNTFTGLTGNQTIAFSGPANSPNGTPPAYPGPVNFTNGVTTVPGASVTLVDAQTTTLTATLTTQPSVTGTTGNITVSPATAKTLSVSGFPNPTAAAAPGSVTVAANDTFGNVATGYRGTVKFTSSDAKAVLPGNFTFGAGNAGTHTFTNGVTLNTVGTQSITATDTVTGTITGSENGITVTMASPTIATALSAGTITVGGTAHDNATLSAAASSTGTGTVTYSYYTNNTCTANQVTVNTVTVPTSGAVPASSTVTFNSTGTYFWQAVYSGDANNNGATSPCTTANNEQLTVNKASPTLSTALSAGSITIGGTANDTATLTGAVNSSGIATVAYSYYTNNTCTANQVAVNTVTVSNTGAVPNSSTVTFNSSGTFYWQAVYNGDANNNGATSPCTFFNNEQLTVSKASPTIATTLSTSSINMGQTANDASALTGLVNSTGTGTVAYSYYTNNTCTTGHVAVNTVTVPVSGVVPPSSTVTFNNAGTFYWQAVFSGDANNFGVSSPCTAANNEQLAVSKATPTIATALSAGTITVGQTAHDSSTLTGLVNSTGTGTVAYSFYTNNTCTANVTTVNTVVVPTSGTVPNSSTVTFNNAGTLFWQAVYSGDANNNGATSPCTSVNNEQLTVNKASPTIATTLSAGTITAGQSAHDTSAFTGLVNSTGLGTVAYSYYTNNTCTTGQVAVNTVTVPASGTIPNSNNATFNSAGTYFWQAVYSGDANNIGATSPCTSANNEQLTVNKASPTIATALSASSITAGTTANDTATLTGAVNSSGIATVAYSYYTNNTCTANQVAVNTVTVSTASAVPNSSTVTFNNPGTFYWQAVYNGDANNNGATSPCTAANNEQLIVKFSPTLATTLSASSITAGQTANDASALTGLVNSTGTGTVAYSYYTNNTCTAGAAAVNTVTVPVSGVVPPSSTVTFNNAGTFYWQAVFSGDADNFGVSSPCTAANNEQLTVSKATPTIATALSAGTITAGTSAHDTSTLTGLVNSTGTGTVAYSYYTNNTCTTGQVTVNTATVPTSGVVPNSNNVTFNSAGTFYWLAVYSGDANNNGATSPCTAANNEQLTVILASPTIATTLSAGTITAGTSAHDTSTLTGLVNSTGAGTVTYSYYTNNTCSAGAVAVNTVTVPVSGVVPNSNNVTFNSAGTFYWLAVYSGDANNNVASSPCTAANNEQLTVNKASPTLSTSLSASSINVGGTAFDTATLNGVVNSSGIATVVYSYYTNNTCTTGAVTVNTVTVSTGGTVPNSNTVTFNSAGTFYWQAVYNGDANNNGTSSPCTAANNEQLVVKHNPTLATTLSAATITAGQSAHDTSAFSGLVNSTGAGTVTYSYYTNNTCTTGQVTVNTVTVPVSGVVPSSNNATFNSAGTFYWQAVFSGDANNFGVSSPCTAANNEQLTVNKASPTIATNLSATSISIRFRQTANDSSTLTGAAASTGSGTVTYSYYTNNTCTANQVTVNTVTVPTSGNVPNSSSINPGTIGTYFWQAVYSGDANNNGATSPCTAANNEQLTVTR